MKWRKYSIEIKAEAEDEVLAMLSGMGIDSVEVEDTLPVDTFFGEVPPDDMVPSDLAAVSFYREIAENALPGAESADPEEMRLLEALRGRLGELKQNAEIGSGEIRISETADTDWINNWKQYFHSFRVDDILIVPSWEEDGGERESGGPKPSMRLSIDPGTAFGTGKHETTQLAIRQMRKYLGEGDAVLDVGAGSGILGIIALKSGASFVCGTEVDPTAELPFLENREKNGVPADRYPRTGGDVVGDASAREEVLSMLSSAKGGAPAEGYDLIVSNIIAEIIVSLTAVVPEMLRKGGICVTSGILREKQGMVEDAMRKAGLSVLETDVLGDWCSVTAGFPG